MSGCLEADLSQIHSALDLSVVLWWLCIVFFEIAIQKAWKHLEVCEPPFSSCTFGVQRFNQEMDKKLGYHTQSILAVPIANE